MPALAAPPAAPAPTPAAPSKPAATPAPTAKPATAPAKPAAPASPAPPDPKAQDFLGEYGADIDKLSQENEDREKGRKPTEKPKADAEPKPDESAKPAEGAAAEPPEPVKLSDLRSAYANLKKRVKEEYEPKIQQFQALESKLKELENSNPPEVKALQERLASAEKRVDELESEIVYVDYKKSKDFQEKYQRPYEEAWRDALADLSELSVELEDGNTRPATDKDLLALASLPLGEARKRANAMFGDSADDVMAHRRKIIDLSNAQTKALEDARNKGVERAKTSETERKATHEKTVKMWGEANTAIVQKWPKMFAPVEGDQEGTALLVKGQTMADRLFAPTTQADVDQLNAQGRTSEAKEAELRLAPKTPEEAVHLHALIAQKIRNHDRLALWYNKAQKKIAELEKALAEYEKSTPHGGDGGSPAADSLESSIEQANAEIDALSKKGPV
jgi:hypothetical protein